MGGPNKFKLTKQDWRVTQRKRLFRQFYAETGNARESARAAGYSEQTAKTQSYKMAAEAQETLRDQCAMVGVTKLRLVIKLTKMLDAKTPRWNQSSEKWDYFDDAKTQLEAYDRFKELIEPEPPRVINHNLRIGVAIDEKDKNESPEDWEKRNAARRLIGSGTAQPLGESSPQTSPGAALVGEILSEGTTEASRPNGHKPSH